LERLKLDVSLENFRRLWADIFLPEPLISESFLAALKKNYRLILLSNTNEIHYEFIMQKYPILRHIEEHVLSFQVGSMKPEGQIYQFAIEKAGVPAEEIFFTDDRIENVEAAKLAGLQAVQFRSEEHLKREMIKLGISLHD
jgi:putative hydrolase of the HAD superfamily